MCNWKQVVVLKKSFMKRFLITVFYPIIWLRRKYLLRKELEFAKADPKATASRRYKKAMGKDLDWDNPKDLNEKINWMKFNTDLSEWTRLSDKYRVREYLKERGREDLLVKLYGVWENADDIDFDKLPDRFVLKSNHGCGTVIIVNDKSALDTSSVRKQMNGWLNKSFGILTVEPQYTNIKPLLIAEELLENDNPNSTSLVDYKVFCLNGEPYCILVCANRIIGKGTELAFYDLDWNPIPDMLYGSHANNHVSIDPPNCLPDLLLASKQLSRGHPEVRVDFYIVHNQIYFGEMTFTSLGGYMDYIAPYYLQEMGKLVSLPGKTNAVAN